MSPDDEMTITCAYRRNCRFLDNDSYQDWRIGLQSPKIKQWFLKHQGSLQLNFYFDPVLGTFESIQGKAFDGAGV